MNDWIPLVTLVILVGCTSAPQAQEPRNYLADKATGAIVIDGILDEPDWKKAPFSETFADIRGVDFQPAPTKRTRMKMLWDEEHLYIAGILDEDQVTGSLTERDAIVYHDNDFEVFIDPDGDGKNYFEIEVNALGTVMDLLMDRPYREGGQFFLPWDCRGLQVAVHVNGTLNDSIPDQGWTVEMAIPFASLMVGFQDPKELSEWRINFSRVEWLVQGGPEENWVWNPTGVVDMHRPEHWGVLQFKKQVPENQ